MNAWKNFFSSSSVAVVALGVNLVGCSGQTNFLQTIGLNVSQENQTSYVNLSAKVDLGNAVFDSISIPVNDPHSGITVGKVQLSTGSDGKATITLSMDANVALHADPSLGAVLPNGRPVPSAVGAANGELLAFPILNYSRVYIGGDLKTHIIAGVALAVKGLDSIMGQVGANANIFFAKQVGAVAGVAGVYGSTDANQSGLAVFARYDIPQAPAAESIMMTEQSIGQKSVVRVAVKAQAPKPAASSKEVQVNEGLSSNDQNRLYNYFYGKKRVLRPQ
jgi:hypothetical protein